VTVLDPPHGSALRRAVVQPALRCGYRFEDEELADEILAEVEGERGALPLLAFALARLWEKRDRENGLITRQAYHDIGGVGGALAQHAEALMDWLGSERHPIVRELFRNLVTAQGTRAARDTDELLSVFDSEKRTLSSRAKRPEAAESRDPLKHGATMREATTSADGGDPSTRSLRSLAQDEKETTDRHAASEVLAALIDARLLTSYELPSDDGPGPQRVEVIHESLLASWPRLVGWRTQDADAARLRDELRHAAKQWDEHERSDDYLWTGRAYREFALWYESYPGGLTEIEGAFASAMTSLANRRRRRRRIAIAAGFAVLLTGLAVVGSFWRRSVLETRRAEAQKLVALGQLELEDYPTAALAYARTSLEMFDTLEARRLALEALFEGAAARIVNPGAGYWNVDMSPNGRWLALSGPGVDVLLFDRKGGSPRVFSDHAKTARPRLVSFNAESDIVFSKLMGGNTETFVSYSVPDGEKLRAVKLENIYTEAEVRGDWYFTLSWVSRNPPRAELRRWPTRGGQPKLIGNVLLSWDPEQNWDVDPTGEWFAYRRGNTIRARPLEEFTAEAEHVVGELDRRGFSVRFHPRGDRVWTYSNLDGEAIFDVWPLHGGVDQPLRSLRGPGWGNYSWPIRDNTGSMLAYASSELRTTYVYNLEASPAAEPRQYRRSDADPRWVDFSPDGSWLVTAGHETTTLWWLGFPRPLIFRGHSVVMDGLVFTPDSRLLASRGRDGVWLWPMSTEPGQAQRLLREGNCYGLAPDPESRQFIWAGPAGPVLILPADGGTATELMGSLWGDPRGEAAMGTVAFDSSGRLAVASAGYAPNAEALLLRIWDLESGDLRSIPQWSGANRSGPYDGGIYDLRFSPDGTMYSAGTDDVRRWNIVDGSNETIVKAELSEMDLSPDGRLLVALTMPFDTPPTPSELMLIDLPSDTSRLITSHGNRLHSVAIDPSGRFIATGDRDGVLRVGAATGEAPHLLLGHDENVSSVTFSPDGRWIASASSSEILLWPMPDLSRPPLHTLPHDELIAKLHTLTNLRVVRDEESATGWKPEVGPFPGWETVPSW
jgi:WD40 repeat protein